MNEQLRSALIDLEQARRWDAILELIRGLAPDCPREASVFFFEANALTRLSRHEEALGAVHEGLKINPVSDWGHQLLFNIRIGIGIGRPAFLDFENHIRFRESAGVDMEASKAWFVENASLGNFLDIADEVNETRKVISSKLEAPTYALIVQCFVKSDTLNDVFFAIRSLRGTERFSLIVVQDALAPSEHSERRLSGWHDVRRVIGEHLLLLSDKFYSVEVLNTGFNRGTAASCRYAIDHAMERFSGFLFIEDDCILTQSALEWAEYHLRKIDENGPAWFVTCESIFFDSLGKEVPDRVLTNLETLVPMLSNKFITLDFVPSTCFGTNRRIWQLCSHYRSFTRGPESLNIYLKTRSKKTISPVLPKASDIGMMHSLGYSVERLGATNVKEQKSTYLLDHKPFVESECMPYSGDKDLLYLASSKCDILAAASIIKAAP